MTLLVISPDFISHYNPLAVVARAAKQAGSRVVFATGTNMQPHAKAEGFEWVLLQLSQGANSGIVNQDAAIKRFLSATRDGPMATILCQALDREKDLLWEPLQVARNIAQLCDLIQPDEILVDHISFGSTLGVYATGRRFTTLVPGHPSQLPVGTERYGIPAVWPSCMQPEAEALTAQKHITDRVTKTFTQRWNAALAIIAPSMPPVKDAFRVHGDQVLYNSPKQYHASERLDHLPIQHQFVGPLIRHEALTQPYRQWLDQVDDRPLVYVALGTFLSHRVDVLKLLSSALQGAGARVAMAIGASPMSEFEPLPEGWLIEPTLPQVGLLGACDLIIHHGGNNSVQEALALGVRQIILPFSTDQFANGADLERTGQATVISPNHIASSGFSEVIKTALALPKPKPLIALSPALLARTLAPKKP
jgi:zeaxanthin glucosyltransferase|tara:strand:- start:1269 stop:2531 length:1263 start_codon:yes stop_codon:yes gene_type:complete